MIDRNHQARFAQLMYLLTELGQLFWVLVVSTEQYDATRLRVAQASAIVVIERQARDIEHYRSQGHVSISPVERLR
jgi:hypothetical protein